MKNKELMYDGLQLATEENNKINKELLEQVRLMNVLIIGVFVIFIIFVVILYLYIDKYNLLYYLSGR